MDTKLIVSSGIKTWGHIAVTKAQLEMLLQAWGAKSKVPPPGKSLAITWPAPMVPNYACITRLEDRLSTTGLRLYNVVFETRGSAVLSNDENQKRGDVR